MTKAFFIDRSTPEGEALWQQFTKGTIYDGSDPEAAEGMAGFMDESTCEHTPERREVLDTVPWGAKHRPPHVYVWVCSTCDEPLYEVR